MKKQIKILFNFKSGSIKDYKNLTRAVSNIGYLGNGNYEISLTNNEEIKDIFLLIKQVYKFRKLYG